MARTFYRPYTKVLTPITTDTVTEVDLMDSNGRALPCNFISVECSSSNTDGFVQLHASSLKVAPNSNRNPRNIDSQNHAAVGASGFMGTATTPAGGVTQLVMGLGNYAEKVQLRTYGITGTGVTCIVTYGNVMAGNTLKDNELPQGR